MRSGVDETVRCPSVRLSFPFGQLRQQRAAGLLLWARRVGDIDRLLHGRRPAVSSSTARSSKCGYNRRRGQGPYFHVLGKLRGVCNKRGVYSWRRGQGPYFHTPSHPTSLTPPSRYGVLVSRQSWPATNKRRRLTTPINHPATAASEFAPSRRADGRPGNSSEAPTGHPEAGPALVEGRTGDSWSVAYGERKQRHLNILSIKAVKVITFSDLVYTTANITRRHCNHVPVTHVSTAPMYATSPQAPMRAFMSQQSKYVIKFLVNRLIAKK